MVAYGLGAIPVEYASGQKKANGATVSCRHSLKTRTI